MGFLEAARAALVLAGGLLSVLLLLGTRLQFGAPAHFRGLHHVLFFAVTVAVLLALGLRLAAGRGYSWELTACAALLLSMPLTKPGQAAHWQRALLCAAALGLAIWRAW